MSDAKREWTPPTVDADPRFDDATGGWSGKSAGGLSVKNVHPTGLGASTGSVKTLLGGWCAGAPVFKP